MTTANKITLFRILLIPVCILFASYYGLSCRAGEAQELWRYLTIVVFATATVSDGIDGYLARHKGQSTSIGKILDPLADKCLLVFTMLTVYLTGWSHCFALWFLVLVFAKDAITALGALLIYQVIGKIPITPHWSGKWATVFQMIALGWVLLQITFPPVLIPSLVAAAFTLVSGFLYIRSGIQFAAHSELKNEI